MEKVADCIRITNQKYVGYKSFEKNKRVKNEGENIGIVTAELSEEEKRVQTERLFNCSPNRYSVDRVSTFLEMYCMGIEQLSDVRFSQCLRVLTDNDMSRIGTLMDEPLYNEVLKYMKENNVKLEQEIVSYYLAKDTNYAIPMLN